MSAHIASVIANAVARGFNARSILQYLTRNFPQYAGAIANASAMGFAADKILKHLVDPKGKNPDNSDAYLTDSEKTDKRDSERKRRAALGLGAATLGIAGAGLGLASRGMAIQPSAILPPLPQQAAPLPLPGPIQPIPGQIGQQISPAPNVSPQPISPAPQPSPAAPQASIPTTQPVAPTVQPTVPVPAAQILNSIGQTDRVRNLLEGGMSAEDAAGVVNTLLKGEERQRFGQMLKAGQTKPLIDVIKEFQQKMPAKQPEILKQIQPIQPEQVTPESVEPDAEKIVTPKKGETAATPEGIGEIKSISGNKALVEIDGKNKQVELDDLIQSPVSEKDLADLHDELIKGIEEETGEDVSRMVNWAGYNPLTRTLAFLPHIGALYTYKNITPEETALLTDILSTRKTSGENFIGVWKEGSKSPIGAAMSALIQRLQKERGGKGKEYEEKFETVYDALEPAKKAAKEKKRKKKKK